MPFRKSLDLPEGDRICDHVSVRGCAFNLDGVGFACAEVHELEVSVERRGLRLVDGLHVRSVDVVFRGGIVGRQSRENDVDGVVAGILHPEAPLEVAAVGRARDLVAAVVLARISVHAGHFLPGAVVVGVGSCEIAAERDFVVVVQKGNLPQESGPDPLVGIELPLGKSERLRGPHAGLHNLHVKVRVSGIAGLADLSNVVTLGKPISHVQMVKRPVL